MQPSPFQSWTTTIAKSTMANNQDREARKQERLRRQAEKEAEEAAAQRLLEEEKKKKEAADKKKEEAKTKKKQQQQQAAAAAGKGVAEGKDGQAKAAAGATAAQKPTEEEARRKREEDKKRRAEERRQEEEEAKAEEAKAKEATQGEDKEESPNANINDLLNEMNSGAGDDESTGGEETERDETRSPPKTRRKKKAVKKDKKQARKDRKSARKARERMEAEEEEKETEGEGGKASTIKEGKFSGRKAKVATKPPHDHKHKRVYVEASRVLAETDKHTEFTMAIRSLLKEAQKVDEHFEIAMANEGKEGYSITQPHEVPLNHTDLGAYVKLPDNASFEKRRPWGMSAQDATEEDLVDPEVNFSLVISCDEEPEEVLSRIRQEWRKNGGNRLGVKELKTHVTKGAIVLYHLYNQGHEGTILAETKRMLEEARDLEEEEAMDDFEYGEKDVPEFTLRLMVPKIPGQDTTRLNKLPWRVAAQRKALHIEAAAANVKHLQALMRIAKDRGLVRKYWGNQAKPSDVIVTDKKDENKSRAFQIHALKSFTKHHVNFHASMTTVGLPGIWDLDEEVAFYKASDPTEVAGHVSMRSILYSMLKMGDGHSLFAEVHQMQKMADVEAVIPNVAEAETMALMLGKNVVAYLQNYLVDEGMDELVVKKLLKASCDPSLFHSASKCTWDKAKKVLTTPEDEEEAKKKAIEDAAWYRDEFGQYMDSPKKKQGTATYTDPENIYDLDGTHSVKTMTERPGSAYGGSPGAPTFKVGGNEKQQGGEGSKEGDAIEVNSDSDDDMSALSSLSKDELIARLRKATVSSQPTGSAPASGKRRPRSDSSDDEEGSSSSDSSSGSSSSGSSAESSAGGQDEAARG
jgi:hypothetical protein